MKKYSKLFGATLILSTIAFLTTSCDVFPSKKTAEELSIQIVDDFENGAAISYSEKYANDTYTGTYTYKRDTDGNILIIDEGVSFENGEAYQFYYEDYKINGAYYEVIDGEVSDAVATDGYDPVEYFESQTEYIVEELNYATVESFSSEIESDFKKENDYYLLTGMYENNEGSYVLKLAIDGTSMSYTDPMYTSDVRFDFNEKIELPN